MRDFASRWRARARAWGTGLRRALRAWSGKPAQGRPAASGSVGQEDEEEAGELLWARLGSHTIEARYAVRRLPGGSFGDRTAEDWAWTLDGQPLDIVDPSGAPCMLPVSVGLLRELKAGQPVPFSARGPNTWRAQITTWYFHHLGSVRTLTEVVVDTVARQARVRELEREVDLD